MFEHLSESGGKTGNPHPHSQPARCLLKSPRLKVPLVHRCLVLMQFGLSMLASCGYNRTIATSTNSSFFIAVSANSTDPIAISRIPIDTNCGGCNSTDQWGSAVEQFVARFPRGGAEPVIWSISGGDPIAGPGMISVDGKYTPPAYLTVDRAPVVVRASLKSKPILNDTAVIWIAPGFLQPPTPVETYCHPSVDPRPPAQYR